MAAPESATLSPFDRVNQEVSSHNEDSAFWWGALGQSLSTLLKSNHYGDDEQLYYLRWFYQWITDSLGPRPVNNKPHYPSSFTYDGSPVEYSLNWKEKKDNQTVRFTTEPCSPKSGTAADILNQQTAQDLLTSMGSDVQGIDLTRFNIFLSETHVPNASANELLSKLPPGFPRARVLVAFDLERGNVVAKAYFNPGLKSILTGVPVNTIVFDAIRKCNGPFGSYDASIEALRGYLDPFGGAPEEPHIFMLSNDCVADSPASRVKAYVSAPVTTLAKAREVFSLGGRLFGPVIEACLSAVSAFWRHVFGLSSSEPCLDDKVVLDAGSRCVFVFEMRPKGKHQKEPDIEVKMHVPGSWLGKTDALVCDSLSAWFQSHGHPGLAARYQSDLVSAL